jgi:hypothetical protein
MFIYVGDSSDVIPPSAHNPTTGQDGNDSDNDQQFNQGEWRAYSKTENGYVRSPYGYYPQSSQLVNSANPNSGYMVPRKASQLKPGRPIPHRAGNTPKAINIAWSDGHASMFTSQATFNQGPTYWNVAGGQFNGPAANNQNFLNIMATIQQ